MTALPAPLRLAPALPFVGRRRELAQLRALLAGVDDGGGRIALVGGESGVGKSRLVRELAHEAAADGALVLYGGCDPVLRTPYGPFLAALDQLLRVIEPDTLRDDLGRGAGELTRLLPDLALRAGDLPAPVSADPDTERHRLYSAVADLLTRVGERDRMLLVVEDLHWADSPTLLLLRHLARSAGDARMVLVATFQDVDVTGELAGTLADLARAEEAVRIRLEGLSDEEVVEFVRGAGGAEGLAGAISELTDGNPFLMTELWRTLAEDGRLERTPQSVRDVVSGRLARVAPETTAMLEAAAVAGPQFRLDIIRGASELDERSLLGALDEAARSGIVQEVPGAAFGFRFTHELLRRAIEDRLTPLRRAELHLKVASALEADVAAAAHHLAAAAPLGDPRRAVDFNLRAATLAREALAFEQAAAHVRTALTIGVDGNRAELQLELATDWHRAGRADDASEAFREAAALAREAGDAELLARAAVGFEEACWRPAILRADSIALLDEAVAALGESDSTLRVQVLSGLARALAYHGDHERSAIIRASAIDMARRVGDRGGLALLLQQAYLARGRRSLEEVAADLNEAWTLADELDDLDMQNGALAWRAITFVAMGDLASARRDLGDLLTLASRARQPFLLLVAEHLSAAIALCEGRLGDAEASARRCRDLEDRMRVPGTSGIHGIQMFSIRREQGRLHEVVPLLRVLAQDEGAAAAWRPGLAALLAELGMEEEARRELAWVKAHGLEPFRESLWLPSLTYLADASAALGDREVAELVRSELAPYSGTTVVVGYAIACYGAADRYLGMLDATLGDWAAAEAHFEAAMQLNRGMEAPTWLAHTAYEYARMLRARGDAGDAERANVLLREAETLAERSGMAALVQRIRALAPAPGNSLPDGLSPREVEILRLVSRGLSNRVIGETLFISEHTAANHVRSILRKTSCANRTEAATYAHKHGLATDPARR